MARRIPPPNKPLVGPDGKMAPEWYRYFAHTEGNAVLADGDYGDFSAADGTATLATVNSNVGTFGGATKVARVTVNGKGLTTAVSEVTIAVDISSVSGVLPAEHGGTGFGTFTIGDILYAETTQTLGLLADVATGNALISGGVGVAPSWGQIGLTTHVTGILPIANGGTNAATAAAARVNLLPSMTGNALKSLRVNAGETDAEWATPASYIPLVDGAEPPGFITDGAGVLILIPYEP